MILRSRNETF
ncbi:Protein CBG26952 [Caenorhabditis briggsae]|uniref:Protein CBG26952 n=1 Tax=Caenorhabditis briggsae TaxID=6238 RepID=B6IHU5_CAEBR|nr:Protein CBG26952 [Caenorhabditis briggsae]CAR99475.1 Protein CBG26952 [Caenorhabditis briggsae]